MIWGGVPGARAPGSLRPPHHRFRNLDALLNRQCDGERKCFPWTHRQITRETPASTRETPDCALTKKPRQVPLTLPVRQALVELSKVRDLGHRHVFVYHRSPVREVKTAFRTACKRAGIENLRFHDLRHCAATNLRRAGVDTTTAMQIIGHKSPYMWKRYNTVADSDLVAAANKLNTYLSNTRITPTDSEETVQVISA